jgi:DNA helicase-2/ATP-dependent DNA helicase PcrA
LEESGYLHWLTVNLETKQDQIGYLQSLFDHLEKFHEENVDNSVRGWLKYYDYLSEAGEIGEEKSVIYGAGVRLLTIHAAKGLEFDYVFVPNLVDQRFPTVGRHDSLEIPDQLVREKSLPVGDAHLEEERRLFYVALTRAKKQVFLSAAKDYGGLREKKLSRFIEEVEKTNNCVWDKIPLTTTARIDVLPVEPTTKAVLENLPEQFSFSQITAYERCPWQYRYQFVLKVPTLGKGVFSFGKTLHTTLQKFYEQIREENSVRQSSLFSASPTPSSAIPQIPSVDYLLNLYHNNWQDDWFYSTEHKQLYRKKGEKILREFYEKNKKNGWIVPISLESTFRFRIGDYYFKGQIDRIDPLTNGVRLIDYKTGRPKTKLNFSDKLQLLIYQWAASRLGQEWQWGEIIELVYYYLDNNTEQSFLGKEKDLERVEEEVLKIIRSIRSNDFTPNPNIENCTHCDFKEICDFRV